MKSIEFLSKSSGRYYFSEYTFASSKKIVSLCAVETERIFLSLSLFARARSVSGPFLEINVISGCNVLREENGEGRATGLKTSLQ